jgi:hypothetical protein
MKATFDELPSVSAARMRALGEITPAMKTVTIAFGDVEFVVGLSLLRFANGGSWSLFRCRCGRLARILRLFEGGLICSRCRHGLGYRVELIRTEKRAAYHAPRILARLNSDKPARLHPRPGRMLDRRVNLKARLRRALIVARRFALNEHNKMLRDI